MKKAVAVMSFLALAVSTTGMIVMAEESPAIGDTSVEAVSAEIDGTVYQGELSTGATYFAYVPENEDYGNRATSSPLLVVYGDTAFTAETAKETVLASGLGDIADHEQAPVILVNPSGETWAEEDRASYIAVKDMFSDGTGNGYGLYSEEGNEGKSADVTNEDGTETPGSYPGTCTRTYVFAEGSGADFVYEYLTQGIYSAAQYVGNAVWKPTGLFLLNADSEVSIDLKGAVADEEYAHLENDAARPVPAVIVNSSETVQNAFAQLEDESYYQICESGAGSLAEAKAELLAAYDEKIEHYMTRDMGEGISFLPLRSAADQGLVETKETFTSENGTDVKYYQYLPEEYETMEDGSLPLVLGFHGGGNDAEMFVWTSGWAEVAAEHDFMLVSVDQHVPLQTDENLGIIPEIVNVLKDKYPVIDASRIYATGFSMGSVMSSMLGFNYDDVFAAIAPTNAITFLEPAHGYIVPTFYNAGENSHFNLPFMMDGSMAEVPTTNINGRDTILTLLVNNGVMTREEADAYVWPELNDEFIPSFVEGDAKYGIEADETVTVNCDMYYGVEETIRYYNSADGNCYTALSTAAYAGHEPLWTVSQNAWDFMSRFSRNSDGTLNIAE